jgi:hypothetical protein
MDLFMAIAALCAIKGATSYAHIVEERQMKCQVYFAACIGSKKSEWFDKLLVCVKDRKQ